MQTVRIQHSFQDVDELSKDRYVNTWYAKCTGVFDAAGLTGLATAVRTFYTIAVPTDRIIDYYAAFIAGDHTSIKIYQVDTALHHEPLYEQEYTATIATPGTPLPNELACCLSYARATPSVGVKPASQRGRVYLGPFNSNALVATGDDPHSYVNPVFRQMAIDAAQRLKNDIAAIGGGAVWCGFSPTILAGGVADGTYDVGRVWVDNAWDIQRRRGVAATSRLSAVLT